MRILIVGAGITGALVGYFLRQWNVDVNLHLWEAEDQPGGRMTISQYDNDSFADIGLQYISTDNLLEKHYKDIYDALRNNNLLEPLTCKILNSNRSISNSNYFVAPKGARSIVEYFIKRANFNDIRYNQRVTHIDIRNVDAKSIEIRTRMDETYNYDAVILTVPVPQILNDITGNYKEIIAKNTELHNELRNVRYGCKYALVEFFDKPLQCEWGAQFIKGDKVFRYVAIDNIKRNRPASKSAVIFHTEDNFGHEHVNDNIKDVKLFLKEQVGKLKLFPNSGTSIYTKCHKWPYATVRSAAKLNKSFVSLSIKPILLFCGDSFTGSKFDNTILTAQQTASFISDNILDLKKQ